MESASIHSSGARRTARSLTSSHFANVVFPEPGKPQTMINLPAPESFTGSICSSEDDFKYVIISRRPDTISGRANGIGGTMRTALSALRCMWLLGALYDNHALVSPGYCYLISGE